MRDCKESEPGNYIWHNPHLDVETLQVVDEPTTACSRVIRPFGTISFTEPLRLGARTFRQVTNVVLAILQAQAVEPLVVDL